MAHFRVKYLGRVVLNRSVRIGPNCVLGGMSGITMGDHVRLPEGAYVETGGLDIGGLLPIRTSRNRSFLDMACGQGRSTELDRYRLPGKNHSEVKK